jgi:uncharacterized protein YbjT (DUF2867 family)
MNLESDPGRPKLGILVTGGTGHLGRPLVTTLRAAGHRARILSRHPRGHVDPVEGDLTTGAGLDRAVRGMDAIIHAATAGANPARSHATDVAGTRRLLKAAHAAGVKHLVFVSIVGLEGASGYPYYRTKLAAEAMVRQDIVPWSILRTTQFHTLIDSLLHRFSTLPMLATVPFAWRFQPVDTRDVAARLLEAVTAEPRGMLTDFGGPEVRAFDDLARAWLAARNSRRRLVDLPLPFKFSRQFAAGALLCPDHQDGEITFEQYLAQRYR